MALQVQHLLRNIVLVALFAMILAKSHKAHKESKVSKKHDRKWRHSAELPQDEFEQLDYSDFIADYSDEPEMFDITESISFEFYSRDAYNISVPIPVAPGPYEFEKNFVATRPTKVVVHGWRADTRSVFVTSVRESYLKSRDCNVFAVQWPSRSLDYPTVAENTVYVGAAIATLIDYLNNPLGMDMSLVHIIGHSLGAHASGYAGSKTKKRVPRISGLDPALLKFNPDTTGPEKRLDADDADFVDVIHTDGGKLGIRDPIATVDFYPNGGESRQKGCSFISACSHQRAYVYFNESILSTVGFWGHACESRKQFDEGLCPEPTVLMGDPVPSSARGKMYLKTNSEAPFALGRV